MKREANVNIKTKKLVIISMMLALVLILSFTPLGIIIIPPVSATIAHTPVIIVTILEGLTAGLIVGFALGVSSIVRAMSSPNFLDLLFINPLVSVLPRVLIAVVTYSSYNLFKKIMGGLFSKGNLTAYFLAACAGSLTNTIGCMGMLYIIYAKQIAIENGIDAGALVIGIISAYGGAEMIIAAIITVMVIPIIKRSFYK